MLQFCERIPSILSEGKDALCKIQETFIPRFSREWVMSSCSSGSLSSCDSNGSTDLFQTITKNVRRAGKHKKAIFMCGAAGTGKTSSRAKFLADAGITSSYIYLNPDKQL